MGKILFVSNVPRVCECPMYWELGVYSSFPFLLPNALTCCLISTPLCFHSNYGNICSCHQLPLVMCHGYGMGIGGWHLNLKELSTSTHVLAKDWLGCGLSSRPRWDLEGVENTEAFFVDSLERWVSRALGDVRRTANGVKLHANRSVARFPNSHDACSFLYPFVMAAFDVDSVWTSLARRMIAVVLFITKPHVCPFI